MLWDPMHLVELIKKNMLKHQKIVADAFQLMHETMKQFSVGKSYEVFLKYAEHFSDFYKPKLFKTMKFSSYCEDVFRYILNCGLNFQ